MIVGAGFTESRFINPRRRSITTTSLSSGKKHNASVIDDVCTYEIGTQRTTVANVVMRIYGECGSEKPWRPPRRDLFYLLAMIAMQIAATLPSTQGGCPAIHQRCYCATDRGNINLICHNVGIIPQVPQFQPSNTTYHMLRIYWRTTMPTVQAGAFKGLKVKEVNLGGLEITTIQPGAFSDLGDILEELYLNNNHLQTIPDDGFKGLQQLTHLSLQYNRLNTVNPALFRDMSQLYSLRLSYNQLDSIPDDTFTSFKHSLAYLYLNYNRLTTLSRALFENLTRLKDLRLNNNQLDAIPDDTFNGHLQSLTGITLDSNRLISVNPALFSHLLQLRVVFLDDNRLLCDCQLAWMRTAKIFVDNPVCFNPPPVHGTSLMSYNISMCDPITTAKTGIGLTF